MKKLSILTIVITDLIFLYSPQIIADNVQMPKCVMYVAKSPCTCVNFTDFLLSDCKLNWYDITFYGTIDTGITWQNHGADFNRVWQSGQAYLISNNSNRAKWGLAPNVLSQSNIGIKGNKEFNPGWSFIFDLETGFDPYSLQLANGPRSLAQNEGLPLEQQNACGDSSRAGQFYNEQGYLGLCSKSFGTLTFLRQNTLTLDGVIAYDPMSASYAFSPIGYSGLTAGAGDTENARFTTSAKYRLNYNKFRIAAFYQFGGYGQNNAADGAYQFQLGLDVPHVGCGELSFDGIYSHSKDAVSLGIGPMPTFFLTAILSDNSSVMALGKYALRRIKLFSGYEWIQYAPPSHQYISFTNIAGNHIIHVNNTNFNFHDRIMQVFWTDAKIAVHNGLDLIVAYYHYNQNSFGQVDCSNSSSPMCHGTLDATSVAIDWRLAKKFDAYAGLMYSHVSGGLAFGYLHRSTVDPTTGLRFTF